MKNIRAAIAIVAFATASAVLAQDWARLPGGNVINANEWMGADVGSTIPLSFETRENLRMDWRTNNVWRMRLMEDNFVGNINGYPGLDLSGFLGLGNFTNALVPQPFAFIHIDDGGTQDSGYRPWMRQGTLITHLSDQSYFGMKDEGLAVDHTVIAWSDNDLWDPGPDRLKFIFVANNVAATGIAGTLDGLEAGRFSPAGTGNEAFFGLGDWFTAALDPTERLDLLNGRARIRQLPVDPVSASTEIVTVNMTAGPNLGVLEHRPIGPLLAANNCEWTMNAVSPNHVFTAFGPADPLCPDDAEFVGIGTTAPGAKLDVYKFLNTAGLWDRSINVKMFTTSGQNAGLYSIVGGAGGMNVGVESYGQNAGRVFGVRGFGQTSTYKVGVYGEAIKNNCNEFAAGVWGHSPNVNPTCPAGWAGYFTGAGWLSNGPWQPSDQNLKLNIEPIVGSLAMVDALNPTTYVYDLANYALLGLPSGQQFGLLAQEVEELFPSLVMDVVHPAMYDSLGNETQASFASKAMNYTPLISLNLAATKELHAMVLQQSARIDELEELLSACCTDNEGTRNSQGNGIGYIDNTQRAAEVERQLGEHELLVTPNPFTENPTISYRIGTGGRAQLRVSSASSRDMGVLLDAGTEAGQHSMVWNTVGMAPGLDLLTLTVDGTRATEQAVKVE